MSNILSLDDCLGGAPPFKGEALVAAGAFLGVYPRGVERQPVAFRNFTIHHYRFFRALRHTKPALKAFLGIYLVSHFILQFLMMFRIF
jgi:hypothetical protein